MMPRLKQSWLTQLAALERKRQGTRRTRYLWLDDGQTTAARKAEAIACGKANPTDRFVYFSWKSADEPTAAEGGDSGAR